MKSTGWRGESYRHYLAAKGVRTRAYCASKYSQLALEQIRAAERENIKHRYRGMSNSIFIKRAIFNEMGRDEKDRRYTLKFTDPASGYVLVRDYDINDPKLDEAVKRAEEYELRMEEVDRLERRGSPRMQVTLSELKSALKALHGATKGDEKKEFRTLFGDES